MIYNNVAFCIKQRNTRYITLIMLYKNLYGKRIYNIDLYAGMQSYAEKEAKKKYFCFIYFLH